MNTCQTWMWRMGVLVAMALTPVMAEEAKSKTQSLAAEPFRVELKLDGVFEAGNAQSLSVETRRWHKHVKTLEVADAVAEGTAVKAGTPLVHFATEDIDLAIRDAELALAAAVNELARQREVFAHSQKVVEITRSNAERNHRRAEEALKRFLEIDRPLETRKAEFSLKYALQRLAYAQEELKQLQKMYKEDDLTEETEEIILTRQKNAVEASAFNVEQTQSSKQAVLDEVLPNRQEDFEAALHAARVELQRVQAQIPLDIERSRQTLTRAEVAHSDAA